MKRVEPSITYCKALRIILTQPTEMPEVKMSGLSVVSCRRNDSGDMVDDISKSSLGSSVEEASRDVQLSCFSSHEELSFMFDCAQYSSTCAPPEGKDSETKKDRRSAVESTEEMDDVDLSLDDDNEGLSFNDDSTVQATSRLRNIL